MKILGLDISSSKIGIALLDKDEIVISEVLKFKSNMSLEERAEIFEQRMREINEQHVVYDVFVEQPAMMFKGGKTTAFTMATLQRFNGMCCYVVNIVFEQEAELINPNSTRS
jgi:RNase H-fold protein (predicted Holliday junction resolvase)